MDYRSWVTIRLCPKTNCSWRTRREPCSRPRVRLSRGAEDLAFLFRAHVLRRFDERARVHLYRLALLAEQRGDLRDSLRGVHAVLVRQEADDALEQLVGALGLEDEPLPGERCVILV